MNIMIKTSRYWNYNHMMCQFEDKIDVRNPAYVPSSAIKTHLELDRNLLLALLKKS